MSIIIDDKRYVETDFRLEEDFEKMVCEQAKTLFGKDTLYINAKHKLKDVPLGASIPDGFLFDFSDPENPEFYIIEVELKGHDFYRHIFPQITKFFSFFRNPASQDNLVKKLFTFIDSDPKIKNLFKGFLGGKEIYKSIKDICDNSQNILLVIDGDKAELPEIIDTYTDTWGKMVKILKVRRFTNESESLISVEPDFVDIQFTPDSATGKETESDVSKPVYSEEYHLEGVKELAKKSYFEIKKHLQENYPSATFNYQKYYVSVRTKQNLAYISLQKKKVRVVVMLPEDEVRKIMPQQAIKSLSQGVQRFYNGPCCAMLFDGTQDMVDFWKLLKILIK